jgi:hypothetical protein
VGTAKNRHPANLPDVGPVKKKPKRTRTSVKRTAAREIELYPDAWERFEEGLKRAAKSGSPHTGNVKQGPKSSK